MGGKLGDARAKIPKASKNHLCVLGEKNGVLGKAWRGLGKTLERFWKGKRQCLCMLGQGVVADLKASETQSFETSKPKNFSIFEAEEFQHFEVLNSPRFRASKLRSFEISSTEVGQKNSAPVFWKMTYFFIQLNHVSEIKIPL